jgi:hypothetical protein
VNGAQAEWFEGALHDAETGDTSAGSAFIRAFAGAGRRLGRALPDLNDEERSALQSAGVVTPIDGWGLDEIGRAALLITQVAASPAEEHARLVEGLYRQGEVREQQAVLRALSCLPDPARFVDIAVGACRTHAQSVFEAIACESPYPSRYFPELNFNQMVLKAIFTGASVDRIVGLYDRITPDLVRMVEAYASERRAAGRPVPDDVDKITARDRRSE